MKFLVGLARIIVGLLFIVSGLIKLNDPVGFAFKLQDYFAPEVLNLEFLMPYALPMAVILVIVEVLLGVSLLLGYLKRLTLWSLLLMIVFFTFLTFYSAYFNKVTDCGCFGDAIPLTPWESFYKDVILLILIVILLIGRRYVQPLFTTGARSIAVLLTLVACLMFGYHVLQHLPVIDFRPYKIGKNITEGMEIPEDAPKAIYEYKWKFNVNGKEEIIVTQGDYPTVDGEFIDVDTKLIKEGYEPPIHDFTIERDGEDLTEVFLDKENILFIIAYSLSNTEHEGYSAVKKVTDEALRKGYEVIGLSASSQERTEELIERHDLNFKFYFCDETTLKTIVRSNPGILELDRGTIKQKLHWNDARKLKLDELKTSEASDKADPGTSEVSETLNEIADWNEKMDELLQSGDMEDRVAIGKELGLVESEALGDLSGYQSEMNRSHMEAVENIFKKYGYPGKSMVGESASTVAWSVLQRNPEKIDEYLDLIRTAGANGELPMTQVATTEDLHLMNSNQPQIYGTQGMINSSGERFIWPISDPENVNERRQNAGFDTTVEEYAKSIFGDDFEYKVLTMDQVN